MEFSPTRAGDLRRYPEAAGRAPGGRRFGAADRVHQRRQPAAGTVAKRASGRSRCASRWAPEGPACCISSLPRACALALTGAAAGLLLARLGVRALMAASPVTFPELHSSGDRSGGWRCSLWRSPALRGLALGLAPAVQVRSGNLFDAFKQASSHAATAAAGAVSATRWWWRRWHLRCCCWWARGC